MLNKNPQNDKRVLQFEDLRNAMCENGVFIRRPPFLEDQTLKKFSVDEEMNKK